ncbi:hypothetical protein ACLBYE_15035 [Methylobacterium sp. A52T]
MNELSTSIKPMVRIRYAKALRLGCIVECSALFAATCQWVPATVGHMESFLQAHMALASICRIRRGCR